jgi:FMN phosphatase YigB (HAD superfamily)
MIKLVISDLDNTLYNWVDYFVPSFSAMLQELVRLTGIDERTLKESFKRVYQRHRTTEYAFAIQELDALVSRNAGLTLPEVLGKYDTAIRAFRRMRRQTLHLYDGVASTLSELRAQGKRIVAHTDAMMFYAESRLRQLGIEEMFDGLVAPRDHGLPAGTRFEDVRYYATTGAYEARIGVKTALEPGMLKPNPKCLLDILRIFGVAAENAVYIGDSLTKDVRMAQLAGVHDIYASYGKHVTPEYYRTLVEITHWTVEDVEREKELQGSTVRPRFTIAEFAETLGVIRQLDDGQAS